MLYVLPCAESDVNSSVRTELPAKRPALFTSATRPTTSAPDGITVSPSSTIGLLSEPWKVSPTWFRSESSGFRAEPYCLLLRAHLVLEKTVSSTRSMQDVGGAKGGVRKRPLWGPGNPF